MKNLILSLSILCLVFLDVCIPNYGQIDRSDGTATIVPHWKTGEMINLAITRQRTKHKASRVLSDEGSAYEATITVLDSNEEGYTLEWVYHNFKSNNPHTQPVVEDIINSSEGTKVRYTTNKWGAFTSLLNWQEIKEINLKKLGALLGLIDDPQIHKTVSDQAKSIFYSKQNIELAAIKDVRLFHSLYGSAEYKLNEVLKIGTKLPNVLGGDPFPALLTIEMTDLKPNENYCRIQSSTTIDQEKATAIILKHLRKTAKELGAPEPTQEDSLLISIVRKNEYEVDLKSGWLTQVYFENDVQTGDRKQIDSYGITWMK